MASTLRPPRSPAPSPSLTGSATGQASGKTLHTRQSLGPPTTTAAAARQGFNNAANLGLGLGPNSAAQPRHVSSSASIQQGGRESLSPRPSLGTGNHGLGQPMPTRANSGGNPITGARPSSEFLGSGTGINRQDMKTPEAEAIDRWFQDLASYEVTLEEMAAASTDVNFTEELSAIEQWFRVLSEAERTAALYSLLQHSTPVQIRFFQTVLTQMSRSDPMTALLSPAMGQGNTMQQTQQAHLEAKIAQMNLKSPSAGGGNGFPGSPTVNQYLGPDSAHETIAANQLNQQKNKIRQNRISAPGHLLPSDGNWRAGQLDNVIERGTSPGGESGSKSPIPSADAAHRPKSTDFSGIANQPADTKGPFTRSPRPSAGTEGLGLGHPSSAAAHQVTFEDGTQAALSPLVGGNWASMVNTPLVPMFTDPNVDNIGNALNMANWSLGQGAGTGSNRVVLDDARKYRRTTPGSRNVSGASAVYNDDGEVVNSQSAQPGRPSSALGNGGFGGQQTWARSPVVGGGGFGEGNFGLGLPGLNMGGNEGGLAGLGMNMNMNMGSLAAMNMTAAQMLAVAQAQQQQISATAANFAAAGYGNLGTPRSASSRLGGQNLGQGRRSPMLGGKSASPRRDVSGSNIAGNGGGGGAGVAGEDDIDLRVLEDMSTWLRVLRLHKYTANFAGAKWRDVVTMSDADLQAKGVAALGARRKLLKVFINVRNKFNIPHPEGSLDDQGEGSQKDE